MWDSSLGSLLVGVPLSSLGQREGEGGSSLEGGVQSSLKRNEGWGGGIGSGVI